MKKQTATILAVIVVVLVVGGIVISKKHAAMPAAQTDDSMAMDDMNMQPAVAADTPATDTAPSSAPAQAPAASDSTTKNFTVTGSNFAFAPSTLTVNKGDTVNITFTNSGGTHDLVIDEYGVKTPLIGTGQSATVTFVADKTGTFQYYCSVGNHRAMGMFGTLTVQ